MDSLEIIYGILIGLSTAGILRVIDSRSEIKEKVKFTYETTEGPEIKARSRFKWIQS